MADIAPRFYRQELLHCLVRNSLHLTKINIPIASILDIYTAAEKLALTQEPLPDNLYEGAVPT
jgi:hypothetical protein